MFYVFRGDILRLRKQKASLGIKITHRIPILILWLIMSMQILILRRCIKLFRNFPLMINRQNWGGGGIRHNQQNTMALFTKLLTPGLTCELCNLFDDWLESTSPTNHPADCIIYRLIRKSKSWRTRPYEYLLNHALQQCFCSLNFFFFRFVDFVVFQSYFIHSTWVSDTFKYFFLEIFFILAFLSPLVCIENMIRQRKYDYFSEFSTTKIRKSTYLQTRGR